MTKEEILIQDGIYNDLVNFRPVYIKNVVDAMESYAQSLLSEKDARIKALEQKNERLKGLIEKAFSSAYNRGYMDCRDKVKNEANPFDQFKTDHNL